jgi:hypothetical protein
VFSKGDEHLVRYTWKILETVFNAVSRDDKAEFGTEPACCRSAGVSGS